MPIEVTRLPSGLTVATEEMPHVETASVQVWVHAGSRQEKREESGISHVLEHMAFKGTARRTAVDIKEAIARVGGFISAGTGHDHTIYAARMLRADVPLALDVLSDILINPAFAPAELAREQEVIVQEIAARQDNHNAFLFEKLLATAFPDQALGRPIAGSPANVRSFDRTHLEAYRARTYSAPNMVVVGAGAVSHRQFVAEAEACFAGLSGLTVAKPAMGRFTPGVAADERPIEQVHFALALAGRAKIDPQRRNLQIFGHILGGDMSSRLFHEAREKRGLCYSIEAAHSEWSDSGLFVIYAQTDPDRIASLIDVIEEESLAAVGNITEAEVARAKAQFKSGMLMAMETSSARAGSLAEDILVRGRPMTLQEFAADIDAVTVAGVRAAGRSVLADTRPAIAVLGPRPGLDKLAHLADLFGDLHKATPRAPATPRAARPEAVAELSG